MIQITAKRIRDGLLSFGFLAAVMTIAFLGAVSLSKSVHEIRKDKELSEKFIQLRQMKNKG